MLRAAGVRVSVGKQLGPAMGSAPLPEGLEPLATADAQRQVVEASPQAVMPAGDVGRLLEDDGGTALVRPRPSLGPLPVMVGVQPSDVSNQSKDTSTAARSTVQSSMWCTGFVTGRL